METMTIEYDNQNAAAVQMLTGLMEMGVFHKKEENDFEDGLKRAISGDELMKRMTVRINKMFENDVYLIRYITNNHVSAKYF